MRLTISKSDIELITNAHNTLKELSDSGDVCEIDSRFTTDKITCITINTAKIKDIQ